MKAKNIFMAAKALCLAYTIGKKTPLNIMWRITNKCNSKCKYCVIRNRKMRELSTSDIFNLIDQMSKAGTQRIGFVGGEALLREDFGQIIEHAKKKGIYVTLVSNGYLIPEKIQIIKNLDCLILSLDGRKMNHEQDREPGAYEKVIVAFELVSKEKINVLTNTVLTKYNLKDIRFILETAQRYGFKCTFNLLQGAAEMLPTREEYQKAIQEIIDAKKKGMPVVLSFKTLHMLKEWEDYAKPLSYNHLKGFKCWAGKLIFNIDTDGSIAPCDIISNIKSGNPSCTNLGLKKAIASMHKPKCKACTCAHVLEYNHIFSLSLPVIRDWVKVVFKTWK